MLSDNGGRDLVSTAELAFDADHRITAYRVDIVSNLGAYNSVFGQMIQSAVSSRVLTGTYDVQTVLSGPAGIYTNTTQVDAYRGAGRPEAIYALERTMDMAARELGVDPLELRRRNFIAPAAFPYRSAAGETYDVGDFPRVLARLQAEADVAGFRRPPRRLGGAGAAARAGAVLLHRGDPRRSERGRDGRIQRRWHREPLCRHPVERAGARDGLCPVPVGPDRDPARPDHRRAGRQRPHRPGRRHRRLALGHRAVDGDAGDGRQDDRRLRRVP